MNEKRSIRGEEVAKLVATRLKLDPNLDVRIRKYVHTRVRVQSNGRTLILRFNRFGSIDFCDRTIRYPRANCSAKGRCELFYENDKSKVKKKGNSTRTQAFIRPFRNDRTFFVVQGARKKTYVNTYCVGSGRCNTARPRARAPTRSKEKEFKFRAFAEICRTISYYTVLVFPGKFATSPDTSNGKIISAMKRIT